MHVQTTRKPKAVAVIKAKPTSTHMKSAGLALLRSGPHNVTPFQQRVLRALCDVPEGQVTTYKSLAAHIGCGSNQAVGQALRRNPYGPTVPCHRVVATTRQIGGFSGTREGAKIDKKRQLLESEGVCFDEGGRVESNCIFRFATGDGGLLN
jgi:methylated-DNA-[protein]-cysteine S-methyltransferase